MPPGAIDAHAQILPPALPSAGSAARNEATIERYLDALDANGMAGGVLVQPPSLGGDNKLMLAALARVPARLRGVAAVRPDIDPDMIASLKAAGIAGMKVNLVGLPAERRAPDFAAPHWRQFFQHLTRLDLHLEIAAEGALWLEIIKPLAASGVRLVVEHFGRPSPGMGARCPGFQTLAAASRNADIWFKLSAPYAFEPATAAWSCADMLLTFAGPGRLVWGSDWPWLGRSDVRGYGDTIDWLAEWVPNAEARAQILGANARTLYGFNKPAAVAKPVWRKL